MKPYQYVVLRCVPRVEREEFVNIGVVLYCQADGVPRRRPGTSTTSGCVALDPEVDLDAVCDAHGRSSSRVPWRRGRRGSASGKDQGTRFGFLRAPRSTVVQPGPVHGGLTEDPAAELARLLTTLVR